MAGRQSECYGRSSIRGNQMNLGVPPPRDLPMAEVSVFFRARPVVADAPLIEVESSAKPRYDSHICSDCNLSIPDRETPSWTSAIIRV